MGLSKNQGVAILHLFCVQCFSINMATANQDLLLLWTRYFWARVTLFGTCDLPFSTMVVKQLLSHQAPPILILVVLLTLWTTTLPHSVELWLCKKRIRLGWIMFYDSTSSDAWIFSASWTIPETHEWSPINSLNLISLICLNHFSLVLLKKLWTHFHLL